MKNMDKNERAEIQIHITLNNHIKAWLENWFGLYMDNLE